MSDITYFILAMIFNHGLKVLLIILLVVGWSDAFACYTTCEIVIDESVIVVNCKGCP